MRRLLSLSRLIDALSLAVLASVGLVIGGLAAGYRPVVILTGSMGEAVPAGSLLVAAPVDADTVEPGQILIMRRSDTLTVTHRVVEVEANGDRRFAITKGDVNEFADPTPHPLEGRQLVGRQVIPHLGRWALVVLQPALILALVGLAVGARAIVALRRIWARPRDLDDPDRDLDGPDDPDADRDPDSRSLPHPDPASEPEAGPARPRRVVPLRYALLVVPVILITTAGVAWAVFTANEPVSANLFGTAQCFDPELGSVQSGVSVHAVDGTVSVPITAVDPTSSFVVASLRSNSGEPADSMVRVELGGAGTSVDLVRATDAGVPPPVTVAWSVVSYDCGLTVQRGTMAGDGSDQLDVPITTVDPAASFVLVSSAPESTAAAHGPAELVIGELADASTVRLRTTGGTFAAGRTFGWQVVQFDDPADVTVQTISANLGVGVATTTAAIASPVDVDSTFLITTAASAASGADIGERLIRAHLVDANTVAIDRSVAGDAVEVNIQVVTLRDGSTVRHGTVDLNTTEASAAVTLDPVDPARATAFSTVAQPGVGAGGQTDHVADDVAGEASATFEVTDPTTVTVTREPTASNASFGWQVVEWAGPGWWDGTYEFRQRIDVDTTSAAAPDAYTLPLTFDHAALVTSGLSVTSGDDVRVLRWDGSAWTELDRVLVDGSAWNQTDTSIWFRTTDPIAADTTDTYWLYFGDDSPGGPPADPEAVFLLTEDFESGTMGDFEDRTAGSSWYQAQPWTRRIPVTVPSGTVAADLTDFPLLVSLTSADLAGNALADASDIRFTAGDGLTPLPHEIEWYDSGTGGLAAWVLVPTLTAGADTSVYLYYGASDAPAQQDIRATWPGEVEAAWHLARDPSGPAPQLDDSTARNHDGLSAGSMDGADLVSGVGPAIDFDGTDDLLRADPFDVAGASGLTVSGLVRLDSTAAEGRVVTKATDATTRIFELAVATDGTLTGRLSLGGAESQLLAGTVPTGAWHHLAMTWDGTTQRLYLDGAEIGSQPAFGSIDVDPTMPVSVGNLAVGGGAVDGSIDEVRVETVARSTAWLDAVATNLRTPLSFLSIGGVETGSWFGQGTWSFRKPLLVESDLVAVDQTAYPLLVELTDAELGAGATVNGRDLVFTAADGTTRLDHLIEAWDQGTGALTAWVLVPTLSSSADTELYLYYGNSSASPQTDPEAVFADPADLVLTGGS